MNSDALKAFVLASAAMVSVSAQATTLYSQAYDGSGNAAASQNDTGGGNGNFATVYDNFTLSSASTVTGLSFTGLYFNPATPGPISNFTVKFYANNAGQPGSAISTFSVPGNGSESCDASAVCTYNLALNFAAAGGTQYWMSIVPDLTFPPQWGWALGTGGDSIGFQDFFGNRSQLTNDFAFTLTGSGAVPEPASWALMIGGFGIAGASVRRRRSAMRATYA